MPGRPKIISQNSGATTPSELDFGERLDRGARDAGLVERLGIAADDVADGAAALLERAVEAVGDGAHGAAELLLREERRREDRLDDPAEGNLPQHPADQRRRSPAVTTSRIASISDAGAAALVRQVVGMVEPALEQRDQRPHPDHRMAG